MRQQIDAEDSKEDIDSGFNVVTDSKESENETSEIEYNPISNQNHYSTPKKGKPVNSAVSKEQCSPAMKIDKKNVLMLPARNEELADFTQLDRQSI